jgi:hypothetical protein
MFACASSLDCVSLPSELPSLADLEFEFEGFSGDDFMGANGSGEDERCVAGEGEMPKSKPGSEAELRLPLPLGFLLSGCSAALASCFASSVLVFSRDVASRAASKLDVDCSGCVTSPPTCDSEYSDGV